MKQCSTINAVVSTQPQPTEARDSIASIHVRDGFKVQLVAAEPLVKDPVAIDWGADGKLWVVEMADYPLGMDGNGKPGGRVRMLEDATRRAVRQSTLFAEDLPFPTGILVWGDGILVTAAPEIVYLQDSTGDGKADVRRTLFSGFLEGNQQLRVNGLRLGLDNWVLLRQRQSPRRLRQGESDHVSACRRKHQIGSRDFRIRPDTGDIDPQSGPSQYGRNRDDWGNWFGVQNSHPLWHYVLADETFVATHTLLPPIQSIR